MSGTSVLPKICPACESCSSRSGILGSFAISRLHLFGHAPHQVKKKKRKRTRHEIYCGITPDYYGYRDDDDGVLAMVEAEAEKIARKKKLEEKTVVANENQDSESDEAPALADTTSTAANNASLRVCISRHLFFAFPTPSRECFKWTQLTYQ